MKEKMTTTELEKRLASRPDAEDARKRLEARKELLQRFAPEPTILIRRSEDQWTTGEEAVKRAKRNQT